MPKETPGEKAERLASRFHTKKRFSQYHDEWQKYLGTVEHPESGKEISKLDFLQEELGDIVEKEQKRMKEHAPEGSSNKKLKEMLWDYAKKAYMATEGRKSEPTDPEEKTAFETKIKNFLVQIASEATGKPIETYEHAIAEFLAADNPIYGKKDEDRSKILDALLSVYARNIHKGDHSETKGLKLGRYDEVKKQLSASFHDGHFRDKYQGFLKQNRYEAEFDAAAKGKDIMGHVEDLLNTGKTDIKQSYIKATSYMKKKGK